MSTVIAIANEKGGVAKTTTAVTVATGLSRRGYKVALVDTDAQGGVTVSLGLEHADDIFRLLIAEQSISQCVVYANGTRRLAIVRSHAKTAVAKVVLAAQHAPVDILRRALDPLLAVVDFCLIDVAPSVDPLGLATLYAAEWVLIPTLCEILSLEGIRNITGTLTQLCESHHARTRLLGVLPVKYRATTREHHTNLRALADAYGGLVYPPIPLSTVVPEASAYQETLWDYVPDHEVTAAYHRVVERMLADVDHK
jgi:chromosome partitioning protein